MALANNINTLVTQSNYINCFEEFRVKFEVTPARAASQANVPPEETQLWINHWKLNVLEFCRREIRQNFSYKLSINELIDKLIEQGVIRQDSVSDRVISAATTKSRRDFILRHDDEHSTFYNALWAVIEVHGVDYLQNHEDGPWRTCLGSAVDDARHLVQRRRAQSRQAELQRGTPVNVGAGSVHAQGSGGALVGTRTGDSAAEARCLSNALPHEVQRSASAPSKEPVRKYGWMR